MLYVNYILYCNDYDDKEKTSTSKIYFFQFILCAKLWYLYANSIEYLEQ